MIWFWAAFFMIAVLLVGLGFAAFWNEYPPIDDTPIPSWMLLAEEVRENEGRHRKLQPKRRRGRRQRAAELDEFLEEVQEPAPPTNLTPLEPTAESWMWSPGAPRAMHRWEHVGEATRRIRPPEPREDGPPD